jgi:5'-deoxynucleotidase YfbR-like HD superfamily hydrolase
MTCRYRGHVKKFYSVAEHSWHVSRHVSPANALWGLLHDAAEAYTSDIPAPLKRELTWWNNIEGPVMSTVCKRFQMDTEEPQEVKRVDFNMLADERPIVMSQCVHPWSEACVANGAKIMCWSPAEAEARFLERFEELYG